MQPKMAGDWVIPTASGWTLRPEYAAASCRAAFSRSFHVASRLNRRCASLARSSRASKNPTSAPPFGQPVHPGAPAWGRGLRILRGGLCGLLFLKKFLKKKKIWKIIPEVQGTVPRIARGKDLPAAIKPDSEVIVLGHGSGGQADARLDCQAFSLHPISTIRSPCTLAMTPASLNFLPTAKRPCAWPSPPIHTSFGLCSFPEAILAGWRSPALSTISPSGPQDPFISPPAFILEEGLEISLLEQVVASMQIAASGSWSGHYRRRYQGRSERKGGWALHQYYLGIGLIPAHVHISGALAMPGDLILLSGPIGDHGIAVLGARGDLGFTSDVESDIAPLNHLVQSMLRASPKIHVLRDPTRGGLATTLNEIACPIAGGHPYSTKTRIPSQVCLSLQRVRC